MSDSPGTYTRREGHSVGGTSDSGRVAARIGMNLEVCPGRGRVRPEESGGVEDE